MTSGLLPPFGDPGGEQVEDGVVLEQFCRGDMGGAVFSPSFHIEGAALMVSRDIPVALRVGPRSILVRVDLPDSELATKPVVERALAGEGMTRFDEETLLAASISVQVLGLRASTWDLWGVDIDEAFTDLRRAAAGEWGSEFFPEGPPMLGPDPD